MTPITYIPNLVKYDKEFFFKCLMGLDWQQVPGRPRMEYWAADRSYTYGNGLAAHTYEPQPTTFAIEFIKDLISAYDHCDDKFEGCFLNRYDSARDYLGWHADDSPEIDHKRAIAVVTLGEGREIQFREMKPESEIESVFLEPGSLLLMHPGMQQTHLHRIPKSSRSHIGTRISLTYRGLV